MSVMVNDSDCLLTCELQSLLFSLQSLNYLCQSPPLIFKSNCSYKDYKNIDISVEMLKKLLNTLLGFHC